MRAQKDGTDAATITTDELYQTIGEGSDMDFKIRDISALLMLVCPVLAVISLPLRIPGLLLPCFLTMVVCSIIVLFRRRNPGQGAVATALLRVVAAGLLTAAGAVVWFVYQFATHGPTD